jgi:hypothetical protein
MKVHSLLARGILVAVVAAALVLIVLGVYALLSQGELDKPDPPTQPIRPRATLPRPPGANERVWEAVVMSSPSRENPKESEGGDQPLPGANVVVGNPERWKAGEVSFTTSDAEGKFILLLRHDLAHSAHISAPNHRPQWLELASDSELPQVVNLERVGYSEQAGIDGEVLDKLTLEPISGATVRLKSDRTTTTDSAGQFRISLSGLLTRLPVNWTVRASKQGYVTAITDVKRGEHAVLLLVPGYTVSGLVKNFAGAPIAGATLQAESCPHIPSHETPVPGFPSFRDQFTEISPARTDANGHYEMLFPVNGRDRFLRVEAAGFGSAASPCLATTLPRGADGSIRYDFTLGEGAELSGYVVDESNRPIGGADVNLLPMTIHPDAQPEGLQAAGTLRNMSTKSRSDGMFGFGDLPAGVLYVISVVPREERAELEALWGVPITPPQRNLRIVLRRIGRAQVTVHVSDPADPDGTDAYQVRLFKVGGERTPASALYLEGYSTPSPFTTGPEPPEQEGFFVVGVRQPQTRELAPGVYAGYGYSLAGRLTSIPPTPIGSGESVDIKTSWSGTNILEGLVLDAQGSPVPEVELFLSLRRQDGRESHCLSYVTLESELAFPKTDRNGRFRIGVPLGTIRASCPERGGIESDPVSCESPGVHFLELRVK